MVKRTGTGVCSSSMRNFLEIGMILHSQQRDVDGPGASQTLLWRAIFECTMKDFMSLVRYCCKIPRYNIDDKLVGSV